MNTQRDVMGREINVTIVALLHGRPDEAAEMLLDLGVVRAEPGLMSFIPDEASLKLMAKTMVSRVMSGTQLMVHIDSQKDLNALAGYFWVEPRRLP